MGLLTRSLQKIFGLTGGSGEFGQIGSKAAGAPTTTKDLELMQALSEYDLGLNAIVSDQGTSVLPYLEDINSLFHLTTSQIAYLMQSGVPEWNAETEYYEDVSFVLDEGVIWRDIFGTVGTPNLNFQPSLNQDKWEQAAASFEEQIILASGALTLGWSHHKVEADTSGGDINISSLPVPKFVGQKLHIYVNGSSNAVIATGTGVFTSITIFQNSGGAFFESVDFGGSLQWRVVAEQPRAVDFETKDLIINATSSTTGIAQAKRVSLLDSNNVPKYVDDLDVTLNMPADLEAGTTEKSSTYYGGWVDSDGNQRLVPDLESVATGTTAGKLIDAGATFLTDLVHAGDIAYNLTTKQKTTVSADATLEGEVSVVDNIFTSGDNYKIVKMSPEGLGANRERLGSYFNNSGGDFDDSYYTQIQKEARYHGDSSGNLDYTLSGTSINVIDSTGDVYQTNDWTGKGAWNFVNKTTITTPSVSTYAAAFSGIITKSGASIRHPALVRAVTGATWRDVWQATFDAGNNVLNITANGTFTILYIYVDVSCDKKPSFHN